MNENNKPVVNNKSKLSHKLEKDPKSTPTSPLTTRWKFQLKLKETRECMKNSTSEPNVSAVGEATEKTANEGNNPKRNSKSEDCLLDLDKNCGDILSSSSRGQSDEKIKEKTQIDDIFTRALKERLGIRKEVPNPGRVMVLNEGNGGGTLTAAGGAGDGSGLIAPKRLINPCLESTPRQDLHRELMFNQKIGKNVLNQKSELEKALSKHKEKQIINQVKDNKETPELERAIAERAKRLEESMSKNGHDKMEEAACNPQYIEARARLKHAK